MYHFTNSIAYIKQEQYLNILEMFKEYGKHKERDSGLLRTQHIIMQNIAHCEIK